MEYIAPPLAAAPFVKIEPTSVRLLWARNINPPDANET